MINLRWVTMTHYTNRCRNIIAALDNLLVQLGDESKDTEFYFRLQAAKEVYRCEMKSHQEAHDEQDVAAP